MPNIIFNVRYRQTEFSKSNHKKTSLSKMFDYYDRDEACDKTIKTSEAFNYYDYRLGSKGGFTAKDDINAKEAYALAEKYKPKVVYQTVLSFEKDFAIENNIVDKDEMKKLIQKSMPSVLKRFNLSPNNVVWSSFYHTNTDHPHCHIVFYEKEPTRKRYKLGKNQIAKIRGDVVSQMNINVNLYIRKDEALKKLMDVANELNFSKEMKNNFKNFLFASNKQDKQLVGIVNQLVELENMLPTTGSMKFNSKNVRPYHDQINEITKAILNLDSVKPFYENYLEVLNETKDIQLKLYGDGQEEYEVNGNMKKGSGYNAESIEKYHKARLEELNTRLGNMILQSVLNGRKDYQEKVDVHVKLNQEKRRIPKKSIKKKIFKTRSRMLRNGAVNELSKAIAEGYYANISQKQKVREAIQTAQAQAYATRQR